MKTRKITKPTLEGDTYLVAQAVNHNAEVLENALNRIKELEKRLEKEKTAGKLLEIEEFKKSEDMAEDVLEILNERKEKLALRKARVEIANQEKWLAQAGYNVYNVSLAFNSIKRALRK